MLCCSAIVDRRSNPIIKAVNKDLFTDCKKVRLTDGRKKVPTLNLAKIKKLHPNRVHNGDGGCLGDGLTYRGSSTNLPDGNKGNNMGHVTVEQILGRGLTVLTGP